MKLLDTYVRNNGKGHISLIPEEAEDLWMVYNIITKNDHLWSYTTRKVQREYESKKSSSIVFRTEITIEVDTVELDLASETIRVTGQTVTENSLIKKGIFHVLYLKPNKKLTLYKAKWDENTLERIQVAGQASKHADIAGIVIQPGVASVCVITPFDIKVEAKIVANVPKKGKCDDPKQKERLYAMKKKEADEKFFDDISFAVLEHLNFDVLKAVILASPGSIKDQFLIHLTKTAISNKILQENLHKFLPIHSSSGFKRSLKESLRDPAIKLKIADIKAVEQTKTMQTFMCLLKSHPDRAFYGYSSIEEATEFNAVQTLLISEGLYRSQNLKERQKYVDIVDSVKMNGGNVRIYSTSHDSGKKLNQLTGIAAILRFPMLRTD